MSVCKSSAAVDQARAYQQRVSAMTASLEIPRALTSLRLTLPGAFTCQRHCCMESTKHEGLQPRASERQACHPRHKVTRASLGV